MKTNSEGFDEISISSNRSVRELAQQQEICLIRLIEHKDKPFKEIWDYMRWHREAVALELSQTEDNYKFLDDRAFWGKLIQGYRNSQGKEISQEQREWIIFILHNYLEIQFSKARIELAIRENGEGEREDEYQ